MPWNSPETMLLLLVPAALIAICGLLVVAAALEQRRVRATVRIAMRRKTSPERAERMVAAELAKVLTAAGLSQPRATR